MVCAKKVRVLYDDGFYDDIISELNAVSDSMANIFRDSAYVPSMPRDICIRAKGSLYGLGVVGNDTLWRFPPIVHGIQDIGEGYFKMIYRGKVGLADAYGRLLIPCEFEEIVFTPGKRVVLARADDCYPVEKGVGLFDIAGATILPCVLDSISPTFVGGRAFAEMLGVEGSVDKYGQIGDDFMEALLDVSVKGDGLNSPVAYYRIHVKEGIRTVVPICWTVSWGRAVGRFRRRASAGMSPNPRFFCQSAMFSAFSRVSAAGRKGGNRPRSVKKTGAGTARMAHFSAAAGFFVRQKRDFFAERNLFLAAKTRISCRKEIHGSVESGEKRGFAWIFSSNWRLSACKTRLPFCKLLLPLG